MVKKLKSSDKPKLIDELEAWMALENISPAEVGAALGYRSSNTIHGWFERRSIPNFQRNSVRRLISIKKRK